MPGICPKCNTSYNDLECLHVPQDFFALRDQFAMAALTGLMTNHPFPFAEAAELAYEYADAMLKAREASDD